MAVLAGCHVRAGGEQFPSALLPRLQADAIVTLGDMGDRSALDQLEMIAPVLGVRGIDDEDDIRTRRSALLFEGDGYRVGCVYDARASELARTVDPFIASEHATQTCQRLFGGPLNICSMPPRTGRTKLPSARDQRSIQGAL